MGQRPGLGLIQVMVFHGAKVKWVSQTGFRRLTDGFEKKLHKNAWPTSSDIIEKKLNFEKWGEEILLPYWH